MQHDETHDIQRGLLLQIENLKGQQETLPVDVRYYSFAGAVEGRADGL